MRELRQLVLLSDLGETDELPKEFRIFKAGENPSTKGTDVYDAEAARMVLAEYARQRVDLMIDLNHDSLNPETRRQRADAGDAMGWFNLEQRGGELWAVNVRWTPEGEARLRAKKQRYISPAYFTNKKTSRVAELVNLALVGMPATHGAEALIAASRLEFRSSGASYSEVSRALEAALYEVFPRVESDPSSSLYVCDVYPTTAVFERAGAFWEIAYKYEQGTAQIASAPVKVVRQYVPAQQAAVSRADGYIERARLARS